MRWAITQNRLFSSSFFVSLSFDDFLPLRDVLVLFLGFLRSLARSLRSRDDDP